MSAVLSRARKGARAALTGLLLTGVRASGRVDPRLRTALRRVARPLLAMAKHHPRLEPWDAPLTSAPTASRSGVSSASSAPSAPSASSAPSAPSAPSALSASSASSASGSTTPPSPALRLVTGGPSRPATTPDAVARCLLVTESLDVGGMDMVVAFLARGLTRHGFETAVLVVRDTARTSADHTPSSHEGTIGRQLTREGIEIVEASSREEVAALLERLRPDVVSAHGSPTWVLEVAAAHDVPVVEALHGMHWLFDADAAAIRERDALLGAVVAVSDLLAVEYREICGADDDKVVTIPNAVDPSRLVQVPRGEARARLGLDQEFLVVSLARHCLQKNTYGLVRAFVEVARRHPEAHLLVTGDPSEPEYVAQVQRLIASSGVAGQIHLRDHCPDPATLLAAADAFVLDSFFEGWALSPMEALCQGLPVVLSEVAGAREQVASETACGVVVANPSGRPRGLDWERLGAVRYARQTNEDELVEAVSSLVRDREAWAARRSEIRADAIARFDEDRCLAQHARLLQAVQLHSSEPVR